VEYSARTSRELREACGDVGVKKLETKEENEMQKITPFLWCDGKAEEAMNFYISIFKNSKVGGVTRYGEAGPGLKGR
jgi:hypothetical protein